MNVKAMSFTTPMVRALIDGRKTQTRRPVPDDLLSNADMPRGKADIDAGYPFVEDAYGDFHPIRDIGPYRRGDVVWCREPGRVVDVIDHGEDGMDLLVEYIADEERKTVEVPSRLDEAWGKRYKESWPVPPWVSGRRGIPNGIFREAARLFYLVTDVRAQRVQDITEEDALAEGVDELDGIFDAATVCAMAKRIGCCPEEAKTSFVCLWDSIYAKRGMGWDVNPWVWAYTLKRCDKPKVWPEVR